MTVIDNRMITFMLLYCKYKNTYNITHIYAIHLHTSRKGIYQNK